MSIVHVIKDELNLSTRGLHIGSSLSNDRNVALKFRRITRNADFLRKDRFVLLSMNYDEIPTQSMSIDDANERFNFLVIICWGKPMGFL